VDQLWLFLAAARLNIPDLVLLDSGEEEVPFVAADNTVELLRRVVSTESFGLLAVPGVACQHGGDHDQVLAEGKASFAPLDGG
jgi:hypothetical protein